jgi:GT2 family glycosyltransferase
LLRTKALRAIGLLDDSLFMYHEDLDLGWRLWRAGWRCVLAPDAVVYHAYEFSRSITKFYLMERNRWLVLFENMSIRTLILIAPALLLLEIGMLPYGMLKGWGWAKLRAMAFFLRPSTWSLIAKKRREKQATFRVPERVLLNRFVGTITDQEVANPLVTHVVNPLFSFYWRCVRKIAF